MNFQNVEFLISAASPKDFPKNRLPEIAFAGKSNVGKSSVINRLLQRKNFARVGEKPGKTIHVNYFVIDRKAYLVDLPGYGFAKVSASEKARWGKLMEDYFAANRIDLGVLIVDYRHPPTNNDITMANWFNGTTTRYINEAHFCFRRGIVACTTFSDIGIDRARCHIHLVVESALGVVLRG